MGQLNVNAVQELNYVYEGIQILDKNLVCQYLNNVCLELLNKPVSTILGREISDYFPFSNYSRVFSNIYETLKDQEIRKFQEQVNFSENRKLWFEFCVAPFGDGVILHLYNITEQKNFESELMKNELMPFLYHFVSSMAHDITSKLSVADSTLELIRRDFPKSGYIQNALLAINQAIKMSKKLLEIGKEKKIANLCLNVNEIIEQNIGNFRQLAGPQVVIQTNLRPKLSKILIDPTSLDQILSNLISNSRDALPNGGIIKIETQSKTVFTPVLLKDRVIPPGEYVTVTFSDNGSGIEEKYLEKIFLPSFSTKATDKGSGLGLSIVLEKMNEAEGHIQVVSAINIGTTFILYFPTSFDYK